MGGAPADIEDASFTIADPGEVLLIVLLAAGLVINGGVLYLAVALRRPAWCTPENEQRGQCACFEMGCLRGPKANASEAMKRHLRSEHRRHG
jgi:hypothetical protein